MTISVRKPSSRLRFINELPMATPSTLAFNFPTPTLTFNTDAPGAFVDGASTVSFVSGVSPMQQQDVLDSTLLAQLAANFAFDPERETRQWYGKYRDVLENIGWVITDFSFSELNSSGTTVRMDRAVIDLLRNLVTSGELNALEATLTALEQLPGDDQTLMLFSNKSSSGPAGNFQAATATLSPNGNVQLTLGATQFESSERQARFLFFSYETRSINIYLGAQTIVLNQAIYSTVRRAVRDKLGDRATKFIADLQI